MAGSELLSGALAGLALATRFNPLVSLVAAVIGAALATRADRPRAAFAVLGVAWLVGDGVRILPHVAGLAGESGGAAAQGTIAATALTLALWAAGGLALGYITPLWAGAYVGRRVTHGTGWLAAGAVAAAVSAGLATLAAQLPL